MNKLEEKHYRVVFSHFLNQPKTDSITAACAAITKEEIKNFAEWMKKHQYIFASWYQKWKTELPAFPAEGEELDLYTTEELIELYLNQDESFKPDCYSPKDFKKK